MTQRRRATAYDYLMDEEALVVRPGLARLLGLNEAIVVQQLRYWLEKSSHFYDGRPWVYNTYEDWQKQFSWWSKKTIQRTITKLENEGIILVGNYNRAGFDNTKWYTLDYRTLQNICPDDEDKMSRRSRQNGELDEDNLSIGAGQNDLLREDKMTSPIPETTQRFTSETNTEIPTPTPQAREAGEKLWKACTEKIQQKISQAQFLTWFATAKAVSYDGQRLIIAAPDEKNREWLESRYSEIIRDELILLARNQGIEKTILVKFIIRESDGDATSS